VKTVKNSEICCYYVLEHASDILQSEQEFLKKLTKDLGVTPTIIELKPAISVGEGSLLGGGGIALTKVPASMNLLSPPNF
jgi:hypothetical protein